MPEPTDINLKLLQGAAELPPDKKFYFNGFTVAISPIDCAIVLNYNNQPVAFLITSYTIAKTLSAHLDGIIKGFEDKTGQRILKLDEIQAILEKDTP